MKMELKDLEVKNKAVLNGLKIWEVPTREIAVIGMAGRFGETNTLDGFWESLQAGRDHIRTIPEKRRQLVEAFLQSGPMHRMMDGGEPAFEQYAYLDQIDAFDHEFFGLSPKEAAYTDPCHRVFLETAYHAFEDAGYGGSRLQGTCTGVFIGDTTENLWNYMTMVCMREPAMAGVARIGNTNSILAGRIAHRFDLKGPAVMIDTACSSSLVAIHMACRALRQHECDLALAGGINLKLMPLKRDEDQDIGILSAVRRARTFDNDSDGTGGGEGVGAVLLKPLHKAIEDHDFIYAVIKGSAVNQDGASMGITAPNKKAQTQVLIQAWKDAGILPESLSFIETHGTGTKLGDPIEIKGMDEAMKQFTDKRQFVAVGSVKTNVGHLDSAAGIAGFIKAVLSLRHGEIPASIHFQRPNREIDFVDSTVYVADQAKKLGPGAKRCGVSAFGLSGTNCHMVIESAPERPKLHPDSCRHIFTLSALNETSLIEMLKGMSGFPFDPERTLESVCYTLATGRRHLAVRLAVITEDMAELQEKIKRVIRTGLLTDSENRIYYGTHILVPDGKEDRHDNELSIADKREMEASARKVIDNLEHENRAAGLAAICRYYIQGADIDWNRIYPAKKTYKVPLPGTIFQPFRHWFIQYEDVLHGMPCYGFKWEKQELRKENKPYVPRNLLVFKDQWGYAEKLEEYLTDADMTLFTVSKGTEYSRQDHDFTISNRGEYAFVLEALQSSHIDTILYLASLHEGEEEDIETINANIEDSVYGLFYLAKALLDKKYKHRIKLAVITRNAVSVDGLEKELLPVGSAAMGMVKTFHYEFNNMTCLSVDIGSADDVKWIAGEIGSADFPVMAAYRKGKRYIQKIVEIGFTEKKSVPYHRKGVYVITGGLGGIGREMVRVMAQKGAGNLAVIGRREMGPSETDRLGFHEGIGHVFGLEDSSCRIDYYRADVSDDRMLEQVIGHIKSRHGRINGILHCAGVPGTGLLMNKDRETFADVLKPKIQGTWNLYRTTASEPLEFFVLFSSTTAIFSTYGQADYTAANMYLNAFAVWLQATGRKAVAVLWPTWRETGMAQGLKTADNQRLFKAISPIQGIHYLENTLRMEEPVIIASELNTGMLAGMDPMILDSFSKEIQDAASNDKKGSKNRMPQLESIEPVITGLDSNEYSMTQKKVAAVWANILGLNVISIHSHFHELGGDSISGARLIRELGKEFPDRLDITDIYSYPTIDEMARYLDGKHGSRAGESKLDELLEQFEAGILSVDEVSNLIEKI